jgi:predicted ATPase
VFKHTGDGLCAVFVSAPAAIAAALDAQAGLLLPVRMGIHTGEAEQRNGDYFGPTLNRAARVMDAGHGGQIVVSSSTASLARGHDFVDLGEYHLKGLDGDDRLFQVGRGEFPALRVPRHVPGNLPVEMTALIGRGAEIDRLLAELAGHRLVTLIGVGGIGKTRLAVETGRQAASSFPDGCWMVQLAPVAEESAVPLAFVAGLGVTAPGDSDIVDDLILRIRSRRLLIVLDNCEHVLAAAAGIVERIMAACPMVSMLVTSREPLMVSGERLMPVPSLSAGEAEGLFVERARAEAPDLVIDAEQSLAITELCRRLDGLPLAIELAASRVRTFTPVELVINLEERFRLLVGGRRSRIERHQTMRGTLDWSYNLCSDLNKAVFDRLSVFPAAFDLIAARAVAATNGVTDLHVIEAVPQLVDQSLLQRSTAADGTTRFRMLETMRAYGREHLQNSGISDQVRALHSRHFATTISELALRAIGPDEKAVSQRLKGHVHDARVALDWCIDHHEWEQALRVVLTDWYMAERETNEMIARLHAAALATAGSNQDLLDELSRATAARADETVAAIVERGLRGLRNGRPLPTDRLSFAPQLDFVDGGFSLAEAEELVASLERINDAPPIVRYFAGWSAIRGLAHAGHVQLVDDLLRSFGPFVQELRSQRAAEEFDELLATMARTRGDWTEAAMRYTRVAAARHGQRPTWFSLMVAWHGLAARALGDAPFDISGDDLVEPWRWLRDEHLTVLTHHGAASTAVALHRLCHDELADRFVAWIVHNDENFTDMFNDVLEAAGLPTTPIDRDDDLETLIDELTLVAASLDHRLS